MVEKEKEESSKEAKGFQGRFKELDIQV